MHNPGKVYFYEPGGDQFNEKFELLKLLDVEIEHCGVPTPGETAEEKAAAYSKFYPAAIAHITDKVQAARKR